jgi:hypothetical protein
MLDLNSVELCIRPSKPFGDWVKALKLCGYSVVGLDLGEEAALEFQAEAGYDIKCFLRTPGSRLPSVDSCAQTETAKRRKPPSLLVVGLNDSIDGIDSYLGAHPNRVEALELSIGEVRAAYEGDPRRVFEWTSSLSRAAGARGIPILGSSSALVPEGLVTPLTKKAFAAMLKTSHRSVGIRERKFLRRLEQIALTRQMVSVG